MQFFHVAFIIVAVSAVGIADIFLKKTQALGSLGKAFTSPWMAGAVALYLLQIALFTFLFLKGEKLYQVGILQTVWYAFIVLGAAFFFFGENVTPLQALGILLALAGVALMSV